MSGKPPRDSSKTCIAAANKWEIDQTDISQASLEGKLDDEDILIKAPPGYPCALNKVLKLKLAVYGLHQAPVKHLLVFIGSIKAGKSA